MPKFNAEVFKTALRAAKAAADTMKASDDGGTCNFDSAVFSADGVQAATVAKAAAEAGVPISEPFKWFGKRHFTVQICEGQGNRRTRMAEAARKAMQPFEAEGGFDTAMYYQMD